MDGTSAINPWSAGCFIERFKTADAVIVQNQQDRTSMKAIAPVDAQVIKNGHYLNPVKAGKRHVVAWIGRSTPVKRADLFVTLARRLPEIQFVIVCQKATGDTQYQTLQDEIGQVPNLKHIERVPFDEVVNFLQDTAILVNTSDSEGFPNVFIQAGIAGCGLLSLNVNPDGFLEKEQCGICVNGDFEKLAEQVHLMMTNRGYESLGANARKYVENHHNIELIINDYKALFERLMTK